MKRGRKVLPTLAAVASFPALVPTAMLLVADGLHLGNAGVAVAYHWLLLHLLLVELPILILFSTSPARRWCRVHFMSDN